MIPLLIYLFAIPASGEVAVENVRGVQRAGTKLVDVYYDVIGTAEAVTVDLEISSDSGTTWTVSATSLSGDIGSGVISGKNRRLTWNAGADWPDQVSGKMRYRVRVTEGNGPALDGFVLIPAGSFQMGDALSEGWDDERPVHTVNVSAFYMAKYETTKELWDSVRAWGLNNGYPDLAVGNGNSASKGANHPVHTISWYDMVKWCNARSQQEGLTPCYTVGGAVLKTGTNSPVGCSFAAGGYRLPTEAEWEKAARGGLSGKRFPWGDTISHGQANYYADGPGYGNQSGNARFHPIFNDGVYPYSSPVGSFTPNGYGLYDMAGNMWEWCWDWLGSGYSASPARDPRGPTAGSLRVSRGGGWSRGADYCRSAFRSDNFPANSFYDLGFRLARSSVPR